MIPREEFHPNGCPPTQKLELSFKPVTKEFQPKPQFFFRMFQRLADQLPDIRGKTLQELREWIQRSPNRAQKHIGVLSLRYICPVSLCRHRQSSPVLFDRVHACLSLVRTNPRRQERTVYRRLRTDMDRHRPGMARHCVFRADAVALALRRGILVNPDLLGAEPRQVADPRLRRGPHRASVSSQRKVAFPIEEQRSQRHSHPSLARQAVQTIEGLAGVTHPTSPLYDGSAARLGARS